MLPETHPLIDSITAPLAQNAEHHLATRALLEETFDPTHPDIAEALARFESTEHRKFSKLRKVLPWAFAAIALSFAIVSYLPMIRFVKTLSEFSFFEPWEKPPLPKGLTKKERLVIGEPKLSAIEQKRRLHLSDPENPAYYAEYAEAWVSEHEALPPDFLETVGRIDPENAYFLFFAASVYSRNAVETKGSKGASRPYRIVDGVRLPTYKDEDEYTITDLTNYEKALQLIEQAAQLPKFETYGNQMIAMRVRMLPTKDLTEFSSSFIYVYSTPSAYMRLINVARVFSARAEEISKNGDKEEFLKLAAQRDFLVKGLATNPDVAFVNELVYSVIATSVTVNFHAAAERLNLTELKETYLMQRDQLWEDRDKRRIRESKDFGESLPMSSFAGMYSTSLPGIARHVNSPPPISASDLRPMRVVEHEIVGGIGIIAVAILILPAALLVFLFRFIVPRAIRLSAKRMACLIRLSDWAWVAGLGIALPIAVFLIITQLTPMSGRDYGITFIQLVFPGVHLIALLLSLLIAPAFVLRLRLTKRLAPFCMPDRFGLFPLLVIAGILAWSLLAYPLIKYFGFSQKMLYVLAAPFALCLCFLFANALRVIFEKSATRFIKAATALAVLPAYPIAIVALCLLLPIYHAGEKHWLAKEALLRIDPDAPDLGAYEFKVAAQKRKEINEIMGIE